MQRAGALRPTTKFGVIWIEFCVNSIVRSIANVNPFSLVVLEIELEGTFVQCQDVLVANRRENFSFNSNSQILSTVTYTTQIVSVFYIMYKRIT